MSEHFTKSLTDIKISLQKAENDAVTSDDKEIQRPEFLMKIAEDSLKALAFLDYKGITNTNLVNIYIFKIIHSYCRSKKTQNITLP